MILGQNELKEEFEKLHEAERIPRVSIIVGPKGSGKKIMADALSELIGSDTRVVVMPKMESIQTMITTAKSSASSVTFLIFDADMMSMQAKNAVLKVLEEPPRGMSFILTVTDLGLIPDTIISRSQLFHIRPYQTLDIIRYAQNKNDKLSTEDTKLIISICEVPGEVDTLLKYNIAEFYAFVEKVVKSIATVEGANAFKIADKLNLKDEPDKYDVYLFLKTFMTICLNQCHKETLKYLNAVTTTVDYVNEVKLPGANKQMVVDNWILAIRKLWM